MAPPHFDALIFDFDGLILDTERVIYETWAENYAAYGAELPLEIYVGCVGSDFGGFDPKSYLETLTSDSIDWEKWDRDREEEALELVNRLSPMAGVEDLLTTAAARSIPCAVASSSPRSWVEPQLIRLGLRTLFQTVRCRDDVSAPKPSPELFLKAAEDLGVAPERCLVLEDSVNGLRAAQAADMPCVAVPSVITRHLDFSGSVIQLSSLTDFEAWNFGKL